MKNHEIALHMPSTCLTHFSQCKFASRIKRQNLSVLELVPLRTKCLPRIHSPAHLYLQNLEGA